MNDQKKAGVFTYHKALAPLLWVFLFIQMIELTVVHLLLLQWSPTFAWSLFFITALGLFWMIALLRSFYTRPIKLNDHGLLIRCGFILNLKLTYDNIASIGGSLGKERAMAEATCNLAFLFMNEPNAVLNLSRPVQHKDPIGRLKAYDIVAVRVDEPQRFLSELSARLQEGSGDNAC